MGRLTAGQARTEVLRRLMLGSDEAAQSPELLDLILATIGSIQRQLALEKDWATPAKSLRLAAEAGRFWYRLPCDPLGLRRVSWWSGQAEHAPVPLAFGLQPEDLRGNLGLPQACAIMETQGVIGVTITAGGADYANGQAVTFQAPGGSGATATGVATVAAGAITAVAITDPGADYVVPPTVGADIGTGAALAAAIGPVSAIRVEPAISCGGVLIIEYRDIPPLLLTADDALAMDEELLILLTGVECAAAAGSAQGEALLARAKAYLRDLPGARPRTGNLNLSPMRNR